MNEPSLDGISEIVIAKWSDRFCAWIFTNENRQRVFNKIGDTLVIKIKNTEGNKENIRYKKN